MINIVFYVPALLLGAVLTLQIAVNKQLGEVLQNLYIPAVSNMMIGLAASIAISAVATKDWPTAAMFKAAPWYFWAAGGALGAIYLTGSILLAPKIGAATLVGLVVTGQIAFSVIVDQFGWFGFEQHSVNPPRLCGCLLLTVGAALVSKF